MIDGRAPQGARWAVASGSTIGSVHVRDGLPLQDAVQVWQDADGIRAVLAVADGHGHRLHFRSDTGAALAVAGAVEVLRDLLVPLAEAEDDAGAQDLVRSAGTTITTTWAAAVRQHLAAHPYDEAEVGLGAEADPLRAYGSTLVAVAVADGRLALVQLGDGDCVVVGSDGSVSRPLPEDPLLDGTRTTSLCQPHPEEALRVAVLDAADVALAYVCTDGFGRPRVDADWWAQTGTQLVQLTREHGADWVREQLPSWLEEPALVGGDDTTMAVLVREQDRRQSAPAPDRD